jgi:hypothetical protein
MRARRRTNCGNCACLAWRSQEKRLRLVRRLAYDGDVAAGQLAVFQGASEVPISELTRVSEQRGKTAIWPRPRGLR